MKEHIDWTILVMFVMSMILNCVAIVGMLKQERNINFLQGEVIHWKAVKQEKEVLFVEVTPSIPKKNPDIIGFKNNNPGNIKGVGWFGQTGTDEFGHAIFASEIYGLRAMARALVKMEADGINTIDALVRRYATGNQEPYIRFLCKFMKLRPHDEFSIHEKLHKLMQGIITFECGSNPYPSEYFIILSWTESI